MSWLGFHLYSCNNGPKASALSTVLPTTTISTSFSNASAIGLAPRYTLAAVILLLEKSRPSTVGLLNISSLDIYSNKSSPTTTPILGGLVFCFFAISSILLAAPNGFAAPIFDIILILFSRQSSNIGVMYESKNGEYPSSGFLILNCWAIAKVLSASTSNIKYLGAVIFLNSLTIGMDASNLSPENPAPHPIYTFLVIIIYSK